MAGPSPDRLAVAQDVREDQLRESQPDLGAGEIPARPFLVGEAIPAVCTIRDVARVMRISMATAYRRQSEGSLRSFELPRVGRSRQRYCGRLLAAWQERQPARVFGRRSA